MPRLLIGIPSRASFRPRESSGGSRLHRFQNSLPCVFTLSSCIQTVNTSWEGTDCASPSLCFSVVFPKMKLIFFWKSQGQSTPLCDSQQDPWRECQSAPASGQKSVPFCSWSTSVAACYLQENGPLEMASHRDPVTRPSLCNRKMFHLLRHLPRTYRSCMLLHCASSNSC